MYEEFLDRCLQKMPSDIDKREGSVVYTILAPLCYELASIYFEMQNFLDLSFIGTAYDEYLDKIGVVYNVTRNNRVLNIKSAVITTNSDVIGKTFYSSIYNFTVIENLGDNLYLIQATDFSLEHNDVFGELSCSLNDVSEAYIVENVTLACDTEDDEDYRLRILSKIMVRPYGGNIADYEEKVLEQTGVSFVKVFTGSDDAPGRVNIVVGGALKAPVIDEILTDIEDVLNGTSGSVGIAPIGHNVILHTTSYVNLSFELNIKTNSDFDTVASLVKSYITDFISNTDFGEELISVNRVLSQVFLCEDVSDATNLKINGSTSNYTLSKTFSKFQIPRVSSITVNQTF